MAVDKSKTSDTSHQTLTPGWYSSCFLIFFSYNVEHNFFYVKMCHFIILFFQKYRRMRIFISGTLLFCFSGGYVAYIAALFFTFSSHILVGGTVDHAARRLPLYRHFCLVLFLFLFVYFLLFSKIRYLRRTGKWIPRKHIQRLPIWNVLRIGNNYLQDSLSLCLFTNDVQLITKMTFLFIGWGVSQQGG